MVSFAEKPLGDNGRINGGFFVLAPSVLDHVESDETVWEAGPLEKLAAAGDLGAFMHDRFWQPMDTLRDKRLLNDIWDSGEGPVEVMVNYLDFWKGKRVLLTGHSGFKGCVAFGDTC